MSETSASTRTDEPSAAQEGADGKTSILVYSDDSRTRSEVRSSVGLRAAKGMPEIAWKEVATPDALMLEVRQGGCSLMILDAEAPKLGGMGLGKTVHDEVDPSIPFILLVARPQDEWLARWSGAARTLIYPIDPRKLSATVAELLNAEEKN